MTPTRGRVFIAVFALAIALLSVVVWFEWRYVVASRATAAHVDRTHAVRSGLTRMLRSALAVETAARGFLVSGEPAFLDSLEADEAEAADHLRALEQLVQDPEQRSSLSALGPLVAERISIAMTSVRLRRESGFEAAREFVLDGRAKAVMHEIGTLVDRMDAKEQALQDEWAADAARQGSMAVRLSAASIGAAVALLIVVFVVMLRENQLRLRTEAEIDRFFTLSVDLLCIAKADGYFKRVSAAFTDTLGWSAEELLTRPFVDFVHPDDHAATLREVERQVSAGEAVLQFENRYRHKDGSWRVLSWKSVPQPGGAFLFATARDVTEGKAAEAALRDSENALRRANVELAQASRLKDEFLANMSHELRTPLNAILGLSEALLEQTGATLTPRQVRSVTTINTSGAHLLALINDILDLSKVEAGRLELTLDEVRVREFCESCLAFVRTQAMHKHVSVAFEPDARIATMAADPKRLKQILVNLLTNAVKFTPEGGRIGLAVAAPVDEEVARFTVWDTGIGIAPEDHSKLFTAFSQIDSGLNRTQEGTGLGLVLVAKLVEAHGGSVALESAPGQGSRFTVTLPLGGVLAQVPRPDAEDRRGYRRALVIEDDPTSGALVGGYLADLGLTSVVHPHGEGAVDAALRERPDVIVLDILLPTDSGWVVLAKLKEHPGTRDLPVVVVSVVDEPQKSRALGAAAHFTKPVTRDTLAQFLQRPSAVPAPAALDLEPTAPASGPRILLAEDNEANTQTIGGYLEDRGYALIYATNGLAAVKLVREQRPALVLMDIQMPVMDGLAAICEIRADAAVKDIPIVALTALAMPGDRERCLAAGATEYLSKPVSLKGLAELVKRLLPAEGGAA